MFFPGVYNIFCKNLSLTEADFKRYSLQLDMHPLEIVGKIQRCLLMLQDSGDMAVKKAFSLIGYFTVYNLTELSKLALKKEQKIWAHSEISEFLKTSEKIAEQILLNGEGNISLENRTGKIDFEKTSERMYTIKTQILLEEYLFREDKIFNGLKEKYAFAEKEILNYELNQITPENNKKNPENDKSGNSEDYLKDDCNSIPKNNKSGKELSRTTIFIGPDGDYKMFRD